MGEVEFLLVREVAAKLRVSSRTVYRLIANKQLEVTRVGIGQGGLRVAAKAVAHYLASATTAASNPAPVPSGKHGVDGDAI